MRAALGFLTILPVGSRSEAPGRIALLSFPLAGLALGGVWAGVAWAGSQAWTPLAGAALVVAADLILTGALHIDAVADVADGIASRRPREEALRIMREPAVGAVGAATATAVLLLRLAWVAAIAAAALWPLLVAAPVCGRVGMVLALALGNRPPPTSLAAGLREAASPGLTAAALALAAALAALAGAATAGTAGAAFGLAAVVAAVTAATLAALAWRRRFGPMSGDGAGAAGTLAELTGLAVLALAPLALDG